MQTLTVLILGLTSIQAWYGDGRHEVLTTRLVLKLSSTTKWRKHLAALQGYVVPCHVESGLYRASEDVIHTLFRLRLELHVLDGTMQQ